MNRIIRLVTLAALSLLLASCAGYTLGPSKPSKMAKVQTLAVPTFKNKTLEPRLSVLATNALIKELQKDGTYQIVDVKDADAVLTGTISTIRRSSARLTRASVAGALELNETVGVLYSVRSKAGAALTSGAATGKTNFVVDPNIQLSERQAFNEVLRRIAIEISSEISEGW